MFGNPSVNAKPDSLWAAIIREAEYKQILAFQIRMEFEAAQYRNQQQARDSSDKT